MYMTHSRSCKLPRRSTTRLLQVQWQLELVSAVLNQLSINMSCKGLMVTTFNVPDSDQARQYWSCRWICLCSI